MAAAGRRAFSFLLFRSKSKSLENFVADPWSMRRSLSFCSSDSKPISGKTARDSLEFVEWHNGGGLYHRTALIEHSVRIGIGAIVQEEAIVGADVNIGSGSIVGPSVSVGQSTTIGYNAVLSNCSVGQSCVIHSGVCIGQDGFGFFVDDDGNMMKKPQMLYVKIGDHVEIGANTCIDRGSWRDTVVGDYTKIDNLVQIGHNVIIGKCCMLCGQVGIAGSVTMGDYCTLGGRVAVKDHCAISSKVRVAGNSFVTKDIPVPGDYGGCPAMPIHQWRREIASIRRLCNSSHQRSG
ncbi:hypothetical protein HPP92_009187 [Vanilla planifolia]|uniref:Uncharacterized protein n=1 Tax=Vanilla planifolia TaxID=51239 RepID=A0A835R9Y0_VANPL|nr:hypothetical protein HPP92_009390 [Vanilla planifolia]KAG0487092.1 hypothetical protein HPP92_009187 [Vanilla planifolia]